MVPSFSRGGSRRPGQELCPPLGGRGCGDKVSPSRARLGEEREHRASRPRGGEWPSRRPSFKIPWLRTSQQRTVDNPQRRNERDVGPAFDLQGRSVGLGAAAQGGAGMGAPRGKEGPTPPSSGTGGAQPGDVPGHSGEEHVGPGLLEASGCSRQVCPLGSAPPAGAHDAG